MKANRMGMPALIGGFGKIKMNTIKKDFNTKVNVKVELDKGYNIRQKIGPYLAGLIEADGSIAVHNKDCKAKKY